MLADEYRLQRRLREETTLQGQLAVFHNAEEERGRRRLIWNLMFLLGLVNAVGALVLYVSGHPGTARWYVGLILIIAIALWARRGDRRQVGL